MKLNRYNLVKTVFIKYDYKETAGLICLSGSIQVLEQPFGWEMLFIYTYILYNYT